MVYKYIFVGILLVNSLGLCNSIFMEDSALYAAIAKHMVQSGDLLNLYADGKDWLDKPHFPFWMATLSMSLLGVNTLAYKLPSLLFFFISLFYTYRFSKEVYGIEVARWAVLILASAMHIIVSNNDVRAEGYLIGLVMGSFYHLYRLNLRFSLKHCIWGSLYVAAAIMTKGVFILILLIAAIGGDIVLKKRFDTFFKMRWVWSMFLVFLFITPELYALYTQFDMHPEKVIFGRTGVSGIYFFFIESQLGRFYNTGPIQHPSGGSPFYFLHTLLWAFAPWSILFYTSIARATKKIIQRQNIKEYSSYVVTLVMLFLFSFSDFQLPHYINIIMPFFAILIAQYYVGRTYKSNIALLKISFFTQCVIFVALSGWVELQFKTNLFFVYCGLLLLLMGSAYSIYRLKIDSLYKFFYLSCLISLFVGSYLNLVFYPRLLVYQGEVQAAEYVNKNFPNNPVIILPYSRLFEFYIKGKNQIPLTLAEVTGNNTKEGILLYLREHELSKLEQEKIPYETVKVFKNFHITTLTLDFLKPETRDATLENTYLVKILSVKKI